MSLAACPACSHNISVSAPACINCGHPIAEIQMHDQAVATAKSEIRFAQALAVVPALLFGVGGVIVGISSLSISIMITYVLIGLGYGYFFFSLYWGLKGVRTLIPRGIILFLPIAGWMLYWCLKLFVATLYGLLGGGIYEHLKRKKMVDAHAGA